MTRSIAPFLSTRMAPPKCAIWISPAWMTDFDGGGEKDRRERLRHRSASFLTMRTSIPPSAPRRSTTSSMKLRMKKMPAAAGLQDVLGGERIGDFLGVEALALVEDADDELARARRPARR